MPKMSSMCVQLLILILQCVDRTPIYGKGRSFRRRKSAKSESSKAVLQFSLFHNLMVAICIRFLAVFKTCYPFVVFESTRHPTNFNGISFLFFLTCGSSTGSGTVGATKEGLTSSKITSVGNKDDRGKSVSNFFLVYVMFSDAECIEFGSRCLRGCPR